MSERRSKIDIIYDMLKAINDKGGKILPTHLLYKSNLSHKRMKEYLVHLMGKHLIEEIEVKDKKYFILTEQGSKFFVDYMKIKEFTDAFGL